jgi:hypothetical protein
MNDGTQPQLDFLSTELPRFETCGAKDRAHDTRYVSRMFLIPKPGANTSWNIVEPYNRYKIAQQMLLRVQHLRDPQAPRPSVTTGRLLRLP